MRASMPTLHCDAEYDLCGAWDMDYYETGASAVDGVKVTRTARAPGWRNTDTEDYCPDHAKEAPND